LKEDPSRHFTILSLEPWKEDVFYGTLKEISESSAEKDALVFIHGYRVDFSEAAFRTAQIATDIQFRGIPVLYSWPSQGTLAGYFADEDSVKWTVPHLTGFIKDLVNRAGIRKLHLIAHSMGNRALSDALMALKGSLSGVVNQIILTAPDIDSQIFTDIIAPAITSSASRVTLYASSRDKALQASRAIRSDIRRAGEAGESIVVTTGIDTVDASHIDTDTLGHSYFSEAESVINDIFSLIRNDLPPDKRNLRKKVLPEDRVYWAFPRNYR
jgi:esterase/lipase superfamily enzyme